MRAFIFYAVLFLHIYSGLFGCSGESPSHLSAPIGLRDAYLAEPKSSPQWVSKIALASGWLSTRCTVTHIGSGLGLTSGHCVNARKILEKNQTCIGIYVRWVNDNDFRLGEEVPCRQILFAKQDGDYDFALLDFPKAPLGQLEMTNTPLEYSEYAVKTVSFPGGKLTYSIGCIAWRDFQNSFLIRHDCDTEPGSSGASLLVESNKIMALHRGSRRGMNVGVTIDYLRQMMGTTRDPFNYKVQNGSSI